MSTCVEAVAPAETIPDHVPAIEQGNFVFPVGREPRTSEPAEQWGLVGSSSPLVASVLANCGRLNLCLHSQAAGFADTYLTFAGADSRDPDFETMLRWLRAKISCWRGYDQLIEQRIERCIRRYRYSGSFVGYLFKTLEYEGRGLRPIIACSLDDPTCSGDKRISDRIGQDPETGEVLIY